MRDRSPPRARPTSGEGAPDASTAPAVPPGMGRDAAGAPTRPVARGSANGNWGRAAPRAPGATPNRDQSTQEHLARAMRTEPGRGAAPAPRRPSMFDYARGRDDDRARAATATGGPPPGMTPAVPTMGRVNAAPRPGFDAAPPPGMGAARPSLLASVRERPSLLSQRRPPAVRVETARSGTGASSGMESGEIGIGSARATPTPTLTSDATPKKRKIGGWGQALARAKTPTTAGGTDAPSSLRGEEVADEGEVRGAPGLGRGEESMGSFGDLRAKAGSPASATATPQFKDASTPTSDRGGWGAATARAQTTPATAEMKATPKAASVDPETVKKAKAAEQRLKVTKEALLGQMERVDGEVASLEKELQALKNSSEEEKLGAAAGSKDEISRHKKETEALRQRLSNAERSAQRAQDFAAQKMREASVLARDASMKRAQQRGSDDVKRLNKDAAVFAASAIQKMLERQEARRDRIERDMEHNKELAAKSIVRVKNEYGLPLPEDIARVDFDAVVAHVVEGAKTPYMQEVARKVTEVLQKRKDAVADKNYTNALAYLKQREIWRVKIIQEANDRLAKEFVGGKKTFTPGSRASGRNRSTNDLSGVARSEYEEMQMIKALQRTEELRHMTTIPNMILDPEERRCAIFDSRNGLVEDPVAERDRINLIRPWTKAEKAIFHERFASYGKNFRRIAEHLEGRDTGDCVMYYYKFQKTDDGFRGRRRAAMKKRRAFADAQRMRAIDPATIEAQREERAAPTAEARLERAALAAASKAAKAKARAEKAKIKAAKEAEEAKQNASKTPSKGPEWTDMEKTKFVSGLLQYGKDFVAISSTIRTRSLDAVKQFYEDNRELMDFDSLVGGN